MKMMTLARFEPKTLWITISALLRVGALDKLGIEILWEVMSTKLLYVVVIFRSGASCDRGP